MLLNIEKKSGEEDLEWFVNIHPVFKIMFASNLCPSFLQGWNILPYKQKGNPHNNFVALVDSVADDHNT